jgi:CheY-like chemotaxis protein
MSSGKILVIDDEYMMRYLLTLSLEQNGFDVVSAADGQEGIDMLEAGENVSIVITDIVMPRKEGIETIIEIRRKFPDVKIMAISGAGERKDEFLALAKKLGANAVMPKPIDFERLTELVWELLRLKDETVLLHAYAS